MQLASMINGWQTHIGLSCNFWASVNEKVTESGAIKWPTCCEIPNI